MRPSSSTSSRTSVRNSSMPRRVKAVGRLVEDQQHRIAQQAPRDPQPLAHAHRVGPDLLIGAGAEADPLQRRRNPRGRVASADGRQDPQVLAAREVRIEERPFDDRADARERELALRRQRAAQDAHLTGGRSGEAEQGSDQRRLAGAVVPEEPEGGAGGDGEVDRVDRDPLAEALGQADRLDRGGKEAVSFMSGARLVGFDCQVKVRAAAGAVMGLRW